MKDIKIASIRYNPNIRITKKHFFTFIEEKIYLYDMEGNLITNFSLPENIFDIYIINNTNIIVITNYILIELTIKDNNFETKNIIYLEEKIFDSIYIKKDNLLVLSYYNKILLWKVDKSIKVGPTQIIKNDGYSYLLYLNNDLFISFNNSYI